MEAMPTPDSVVVGMKVLGAAGLAQWAREHTRAFHRTLRDFCNDRFLFCRSHIPGGFSCRMGTTCRKAA